MSISTLKLTKFSVKFSFIPLMYAGKLVLQIFTGKELNIRVICLRLCSCLKENVNMFSAVPGGLNSY